MRAYLDLLKKIMDEGVTVQTGATLTSEGRQPTAKSLFAAQFRHDLADGFPAVTTKKFYFASMVKEMLWFLRGETNVKTLGCGIWNEWADPTTGDCGPIYGYQWRRQEHIRLREPGVFPAVSREELGELIEAYGTPTVAQMGFRGEPDSGDPHYKTLLGLWIGMIHRCYDSDRPEYAFYGAKGVHVDPRWLVFSNFQRDAKKLSGWQLKATRPDSYWLDKDFHATNRYGPDTCIWASTEEQHLNVEKAMLIRATGPTGDVHTTIGGSRFARLHGLDPSSVYKCIRGERAEHKGWRFEQVDTGGLTPRIQIIDQIGFLVADLKAVVANPVNRARRRLILTGWNPPDVPKMGLPPCHTAAQFLPVNGKLNCHCFWRSIDAFTGMPFNLGQYALLTHILAEIAGLEPGELVASVTDLHVYDNQFDAVNEQLTRTPAPLPFLAMPNLRVLAPDLSVDQVRALDADMFSLVGYVSMGALRAEVAV